jgi:hypothetical protein
MVWVRWSGSEVNVGSLKFSTLGRERPELRSSYNVTTTDTLTLVSIVLAVLLSLTTASGVDGAALEEASGITRLDDALLIVGDKTPGAYYTYPVARYVSQS